MLGGLLPDQYGSLWIEQGPGQGCGDLQTPHSRPQPQDPGDPHILQGVFLLDLLLPLVFQHLGLILKLS